MSTGTILAETVRVLGNACKKNTNGIFHFPTVKPLDSSKLNFIASNFDFIVTVEEHSLIGGFGSSVADWLVDNLNPINCLESNPDLF